MDYWLGMFRDAGLVEWSPSAHDIVVLRQPTPAEIDSARLDGEVCYG